MLHLPQLRRQLQRLQQCRSAELQVHDMLSLTTWQVLPQVACLSTAVPLLLQITIIVWQKLSSAREVLVEQELGDVLLAGATSGSCLFGCNVRQQLRSCSPHGFVASCGSAFKAADHPTEAVRLAQAAACSTQDTTWHVVAGGIYRRIGQSVAHSLKDRMCCRAGLAAILLHFAFLLFNILVTWLLRFPEKERKAVIVMASQKNLPTAAGEPAQPDVGAGSSGSTLWQQCGCCGCVQHTVLLGHHTALKSAQRPFSVELRCPLADTPCHVVLRVCSHYLLL
jgi:hypothetical protein